MQRSKLFLVGIVSLAVILGLLLVARSVMDDPIASAVAARELSTYLVWLGVVGVAIGLTGGFLFGTMHALEVERSR